MRISVIIATLGRPHILARTIASVARCDPPPDELIVIDGDHGRSSERVTRGDHPFPIRYFTSDRGLPKQRNAGIDNAAGDVFVFVDDDVELPRDTFRVLERVFADDGLLGATGRIVEPRSDRIGKKHSPVRRLLPGGGAEGRFTRYGYPRRLIDLESERDVDFMHGSFMSVRANTAKEVRFDEALPGYALAEDEDFSYRVSRRGRIRFVPELHVIHAKEGHGARDARAFGRTVVINRAYLFRKNFRTGVLPRLQFGMLIVLFMAHRLVNREWAEFRGLVEGSVIALRRPLARHAPPPGEAPPKVAFISSHARAGGSERYLTTLLNLLERDIIGPVVALEHGPLVDELWAAGRDVHVLPTGGSPFSTLGSALRLRRYLRSHPADVVHANGVKAALVTGVARPRAPIVWVKHDFSFDGWRTRSIARRCAAVVGVSGAVLQSLSSTQRASAHVVHTGIDVPDVDRAEARRKLRVEIAAEDGDFVVGIVGRLHPVKGHLDFIAAAETIARHRPGARFVIVGGDDPSVPGFADEVRAAARSLGDRLHLLGHRDEVAPVIAALDVGVMTSHRDGESDVEAFPLIALEMLAVGTPVVAYASGGIPELLGECGVLVAPGDKEALAAAIVALVDDAERTRRLSECGPKRVAGAFTLDRMAASMTNIYRSTSKH